MRDPLFIRLSARVFTPHQVEGLFLLFHCSEVYFTLSALGTLDGRIGYITQQHKHKGVCEIVWF